MVAYKLKGDDSAWWDRIQTTRRRHGEEINARTVFTIRLSSDFVQAIPTLPTRE